MRNYHLSLRNQVNQLIRLLEQEPDLLVHVKNPSEKAELTKKPKAGEKIHSPKPSYHRDIDFDAVDLKTDLIAAYRANDHEEMSRNYYHLINLLGI